MAVDRRAPVGLVEVELDQAGLAHGRRHGGVGEAAGLEPEQHHPDLASAVGELDPETRQRPLVVAEIAGGHRRMRRHQERVAGGAGRGVLDEAIDRQRIWHEGGHVAREVGAAGRRHVLQPDRRGSETAEERHLAPGARDEIGQPCW
jgi:hypothetical protein